MSPFATALEYYRTLPDADFLEDVFWHQVSGRVIITPFLFVMARPVCSWWSPQDIADPSFNVLEGTNMGQLEPSPDCLHIHMLIGEIEEALHFDPWHLDLISYQRCAKGDPRLRIIPRTKFSSCHSDPRHHPHPHQPKHPYGTLGLLALKTQLEPPSWLRREGTG